MRKEITHGQRMWLAFFRNRTAMVEIVFSRPGLGKLLVGAIKQRDYTTLQSVMVFYAFLVVVCNLITELAYGMVDPRIKYN
jgi:ABC-type dipeptide/oligopeptide/nickel transport system permease component